MNNFTVEFYINKEWVRNDRAVFTPKFANLLDEQLDEATITLKGDSTAYYKPFTLVRITITNNPEAKVSKSKSDLIKNQKETSVQVHSYNYDDERITQKLNLYMFVANDKAIETPVGSGKYNHELYLIELTKITERYICDTLTFTNPLGNNFLGQNEESNTTYSTFKTELYNTDGLVNDYGYKVTSYRTPTPINQTFTIINPLTFFQNDGGVPGITNNDFALSGGVYITDSQEHEIYKQYISNGHLYEIYNDSIISDVEYDIFSGVIPWKNGNITFSKTGIFNIKYTTGNPSDNYISQGAIAVVYNRLPLKKWTITDVIKRVFDLVEEVDYSQEIGTNLILPSPKFVLNTSQAVKYEQILAPEFSFTKSTLREILQQIGGFIHAEPRIQNYDIDNNKFYISFDEYGSNKYSKISEKPYITATFGTDINQYCTAIDSSADNLTNTLDWAQGVLIEPYNYGAKSLRTETIATRFAEDDSTVISTQFPIGRVQKLECRYIPGKSWGNWDLTPYLFEITAYSSELSSYDGVYPFSKAYALCYTLGEKNIKGLFFKAPELIDSLVHKYSIVNILRIVTGDNNLDINAQDLMKLSFAVTYMPLYSARIKTHKQLIQEGLSTTLAYNQGANAIESRYFGEHLKGVVERLGNVEKTYTYKLAFLSQIPVAGTRFDNNYYISNVSWELYPTYIKCSVGLSKHFNRLSQYVGINSQKRMWEISERQSVIRQSAYPLYIVVSENQYISDISNVGKINQPAKILFKKDYFAEPISAAKVATYDIKGNTIADNILMPVVASAFGNSMLFTYAFEDNYSVGQKVEEKKYQQSGEEISGYWGNYVKYTNYYGRFYLLETSLITTKELKNTDLSLSLPQLTANNNVENEVLYKHTCVYRKDNREIPQITHQITVVTDNDKIIIGSALCRNSPVINANPKQLRVYYLSEEINLFNNRINSEKIIKEDFFTVKDNYIEIQPNTNCKAWAIATEISETSETIINIEEEDGTQSTQTIQEGGEILLAQNNPVFKNGYNKIIYFGLKQKIND